MSASTLTLSLNEKAALEGRPFRLKHQQSRISVVSEGRSRQAGAQKPERAQST
ncbi:hypothetical protein WQQ_17850 [Hydrocarboniphaga effusa AP103]|uniref:Uncharacterized protein n=1 Tax=Hydrocarboniphaga effusa AP103 TaxID=1172194 RepID=I8TD75_9GAMM|nr:hypothetical protein WQQ_17850 [Hydrocarboniphaga effusa AP103]